MKIAVLMGGTSPEREISIRTGAGVSRALETLGHEVVLLDTGTGTLLQGAELHAALGNPAGPTALAPVDEAAIASQQAVADAFAKVGSLPAHVDVRPLWTQELNSALA